jgi:hypothetical protein
LLILALELIDLALELLDQFLLACAFALLLRLDPPDFLLDLPDFRRPDTVRRAQPPRPRDHHQHRQRHRHSLWFHHLLPPTRM